jgi:hypothetical protein
MDGLNDSQTIGSQLGDEAFNHAECQGEEYRIHERQRIDAANQSKVLILKATLGMLAEDEDHLRQRIHAAPPPGDLRSRRRKAAMYWLIVAGLTIAAFVFSMLTFEPFRFGWKAWGYCLGIAIIVPFLVDRTIESWEAPGTSSFRRLLTTTACAVAITGVLLLAIIRGHLFGEQVRNVAPAVTIENESAAAPANEQTFYDKTGCLMQTVMALLALGMEVGTGLAAYEARRWSTAGADDADQLRLKLRGVRQQMIECGHEIKSLEQESAEFEERFQRDFVRSILKRAKDKSRLIVWILISVVGLTALPRARAVERLNLVVAIDLTASVAGAKGLDATTELQSNVAGVSQLLMRVPAGSRITVLGITDASFARPYTLLSAEVGADKGYFDERLAAARRQLVAAWQKRSATLVSQFRATDLLGALVVSSQVFQAQHGYINVLVIFSDMRHHTKSLDLETPAAIPMRLALSKAEANHLIVDLKGVDVDVLGVDGNGKQFAYWDSLRNFWSEYFKKTGAKLREYSMLRDVPVLARY